MKTKLLLCAGAGENPTFSIFLLLESTS